MRKKPYTTVEFFDEIVKRIDLPTDILEYSSAYTIDPIELRDIGWDYDTRLDFGGNEGIYLTMNMIKRKDGKPEITTFGIFKTLLTTKDAMRKMSQIAADFIYEAHEFVNENMDDFNWTGYDLAYYDDEKQRYVDAWWCSTEESMKKKKDDLLTRYSAVSVRNNETRKTRICKA